MDIAILTYFISFSNEVRLCYLVRKPLWEVMQGNKTAGLSHEKFGGGLGTFVLQ
jgi:hypothetical protein